MKSAIWVVRVLSAGALAALCLSCASMPPVEGAGAHGVRHDGGTAAVREDVWSETPVRALPGAGTTGQGSAPRSDYGRSGAAAGMTKDPSGAEDTISFRDLPGIRVDGRSPGGSAGVGHDLLIEKELKRLLREFGEKGSEVDAVFLDEVKFSIRVFQTNGQYRRFMTNSLRRAATYLPAVKEVFRKRNIPEDMAFIAFLESGFNPGARSRAGAVGMWQFMPGTARRYSLKVSDRVDDRLDPVKSTFAAVEYFHDLIAIFGPRSFLLALAAYNCGEGKIISCLKRIDNPMEERSFWHIRTCLAEETREYPPKIIAAAVIGSNPEIFGFPGYDGGGESSAVSVAFAAYRAAGEPVRELRPPAEQAHRKRAGRPKAAAGVRPSKPKPVMYMVKRNNTLTVIAEIFGVEKEKIRQWNGMKGSRVRAGQNLKIYPPAGMDVVRYRVKKGDTIMKVCRAFGVRPHHVIAGNGLADGLSLKYGRTLVIYRTAAKKQGRGVAGRRAAEGTLFAARPRVRSLPSE